MVGFRHITNAVMLATLFAFSPFISKAQLHCGSLEFVSNATETALFSFDEFRDYHAGINLYNVATLRISVTDQVVPDPACSWFLNVSLDNNPGSGTLPTDWEELAPYSLAIANPPTIEELEIRIRNSCATSPADNVFRTVSNHADILEIIESLLPVTPAGSCNTNVNGAGSYLTNPGEYIFHIDLRLQPGFAFDPGVYALNLRFHLEENP